MTDAYTDTRDAYDRAGEAYDSLSADFHREVAYPALIRILSRGLGTLEGCSVLDVGCGSGRLVRTLSEKGMDAHGIDLSTEMVTRGNASGLSLVPGTMLDLPYQDSQFDAVVSYHSFNYVPFKDQAKAIEEQCRVLKRGGSLLLAVFFTPKPVRTPHLVESEGEVFTLHLRTLDEMRDLLSCCHCIASEAPIATPKEVLLVPEGSQHLIRERPYALFVLAERIV